MISDVVDIAYPMRIRTRPSIFYFMPAEPLIHLLILLLLSGTYELYDAVTSIGFLHACLMLSFVDSCLLFF